MMSDNEPVGDEASERGRSRSNRRSGWSKRRPASSSAGGGGETCHLCSETICDGDNPKYFKGVAFHPGACFAAVRCRRRVLDKQGGMAAADGDEMMIANPEQWRQVVQPLVVSPGYWRTPAQRRKAKPPCRFNDDVSEDMVLEDDLILTKRRFKKFRKDWDGMSSDEASMEFEGEVDQQQQKYCSRGTDRIAVPDIPRLRRACGTRRVSRREEVDEADGDDGGESRADSSQRQEQQGRQGREPRQFQMPPGRRPRMTSGSGDEKAPRAALESSREQKVPLTMANVNKLANSSAPRRSPSCAASTSRPASPIRRRDARGQLPPPSGKKPLTPSKPSVVEVVQMKSVVKKRAQSLLSDARSPRNAYKKLEAIVKKLSPDQTAELGEDPKPLLVPVADVINELLAIGVEVESAKAHQMEYFNERLQEASSILDEGMSDCEEMVKAASFVLDTEKSVARREKNVLRYQRRKLVTKLVANGHGPGMAKLIAPQLEEEEEEGSVAARDPEKFDPGKLTVWTTASECGKSVNGIFEQVCPQEIIALRQAALEKYMKENLKSGGSMGRVEVTIASSVNPLDLKPELIDHAGAVPWLVCAKPHHLRYGPHAMPLCGVGCLMKWVSGNPVTIFALPANEVLSQGISPRDLPAHLETHGGSEVFSTHKKMVELKPESIVWVPYGWLAWPLNWRCSDQGSEQDEQQPAADQASPEKVVAELQAKAKAEKAPNAFLLHWPMFSSELAKAASQGSAAAVVSWNKAHLAKQSMSRAFGARADTFSEFEKLMED